MQPSQRLRPIRPDAFLVARQAGADVGSRRRPGPWPRSRRRRSDPDHPDQVAVTVVEGPVRLQGVLEPADPDDGEVDRRPGWRSG